MTSEEIVKALREECKTCSEMSVCMNGTSLAGFYCAISDAADMIERLEKEKAALLEYAKKSAGCDQCKADDTQCDAASCIACKKECVCGRCVKGSKWEWKGLG